MIEIKNISKSFGKKVVLNDISLSIPTNNIFGLVGINGAGKSTLLKLLSNAYDPTSGEILYDGVPVSAIQSKKDIFFLPDEPYSSRHETVKSLLEFYQSLYDFTIESFDKYVKTFKLDVAIGGNIYNKNINKFSKGMKRQLFICIALAISPKYLFLDEAFDGLDPLARLTFKRIILKKLETTEMTIIISSHSLRELEDLCDSYGLIDNATIENTGNIEENKKEYQKYQLAFIHDVSKDLFEDLKVVSFSKIGRIIKLIVEGNEEDNYNALLAKNPILIDKLPIDFEELFIIKVESKGYIAHEE